MSCRPAAQPSPAPVAATASGNEAAVPSESELAQSGLIVQVANGSLHGIQVGATREFLGIPYAKPPLGALRFAPPEPVEPSREPRDAMHFGPGCPQPNLPSAHRGPLAEDCLTLNVYTPRDVARRLPVMVFIHGGAFSIGASSQYDGKILSEAPVVVVTLNYRLGAFGFMAHPALDATRPGAPSGSDGLRDQQLALRWVRDNIAAFGGDPENVTLFGESAGAISSCVHWVAPSSQGLAQRFIIQSGGCTNDGYGVQTKEAADALGKKLGDALCAGEPDVLACLRSKPVEELSEWGQELGQFGPPWQPAIEGRGGILPDTVERLIAIRDQLPPIIVGTNAREWGLFQKLGSKTPRNQAELASTLAATFGDKAALVEAAYPMSSEGEANDVWVRLVTDVTFRCPARSVALLASRRGASVYVYSFEQGSAFHAQELDYVFADSLMVYYGGGPPSAALTSVMQRYWTRFASTGDPNGAGDPGWPRFEAGSDRHLVLVDPPRPGQGLASAECEFWRDYFLRGGSIDLH